jgi:putative nucleotidyltransferase with HDIG domain
MNPIPSRHHALALVEEWVQSPSLRVHMLAVEASVRHYARLLGADPELWGLAALLHDLDWERHPEQHPLPAVEHLRELGYPEPVLRAILAHRPDFTGVEPESELDRVLFACDELSGFVVACCLVRPTGILDLEPRSVIKKLKDRAFAAGVSRDDVARGVELIGLPRDEHIRHIIDALLASPEDLGIRKTESA